MTKLTKSNFERVGLKEWINVTVLTYFQSYLLFKILKNS